MVEPCDCFAKGDRGGGGMRLMVTARLWCGVGDYRRKDIWFWCLKVSWFYIVSLPSRKSNLTFPDFIAGVTSEKRRKRDGMKKCIYYFIF